MLYSKRRKLRPLTQADQHSLTSVSRLLVYIIYNVQNINNDDDDDDEADDDDNNNELRFLYHGNRKS